MKLDASYLSLFTILSHSSERQISKTIINGHSELDLFQFVFFFLNRYLMMQTLLKKEITVYLNAICFAVDV